MNGPSTYVVPPVYEAMIVGFDAVEIGVRKAYLIKSGQRVTGAFYKQADNLAEKTFFGLVDFILKSKVPGAAA